jgi:hypothetical protein
MIAKRIGYRDFVDDTRRAMFEDEYGQFVKDDDGDRVYGQWLREEDLDSRKLNEQLPGEAGGKSDSD